MEHDIQDNADRFIAISSLLGHEVNKFQNGLVNSYEVVISVRKQIEIRRLKKQLKDDNVIFSVIGLGKNTRYRSFRCRCPEP